MLLGRVPRVHIRATSRGFVNRWTYVQEDHQYCRGRATTPAILAVSRVTTAPFRSSSAECYQVPVDVGEHQCTAIMEALKGMLQWLGKHDLALMFRQDVDIAKEPTYKRVSWR